MFSIVHNSLTNVLRHSQAASASVTLVFGTDSISLTIADDGVGLPADFDERGEGIHSMLDSAEQMGGRLHVSSGLSDAGTTVTCWVPHVLELGGQKVV